MILKEGHQIYENGGLTVYTNNNVFYKPKFRNYPLLDVLRQWIDLGQDNRSQYTIDQGTFDFFYTDQTLTHEKLERAGKILGFTRGTWSFCMKEDYAVKMDILNKIKTAVFDDLVFPQIMISVNNGWYRVFVTDMGDSSDRSSVMTLGQQIMNYFCINKLQYKPEIYKAFKLDKNNRHELDVYPYKIDETPSEGRKVSDIIKDRKEAEKAAKILEKDGWFNE